MPNNLKSITKKLGIPQKELIKTIKVEMEWDVETIDDTVTEFYSSLDDFAEKLTVKVTEKITCGKRFGGYTDEEQKALYEKVYKMCFRYALERLDMMYGE
jgi:hypothetical protein